MFLLVPQVKLSKRLDVARAAEQVLDALKALLEMVPGALVERNSVLPEKFPDGGLIILRDGDPGEPEQALGGFHQHAVEIEVTYRRPEPAIEAVAGAPAIKSATLTVTVDYETDAPLA